MMPRTTPESAAAKDDEQSLWFDVSQMIVHFGRYGKPTGIERVTCCLLAAIRERQDLVNRAHLFRIDAATGRFHVVDWKFLDLVIGTMSAAQTEGVAQPFGVSRGSNRPGWLARVVYERLPYELQPATRQLALGLSAFGRALLPACKKALRSLGRAAATLIRRDNAGAARQTYREHIQALTAPAAEPPPGAILVNFGGTWTFSRHAGAIKGLKRASGARYAVMVHDIISLTDPDYFPGYFTPLFRDWLIRNLSVADCVLTVSEATRASLLGWCKANNLALAKVTATPLAQNFPVEAGVTPAPLPAALLGRQFALFVSTLDVRKNHVLLLDVWKKLMALHGARTPRLVFVGNRGWGVDDLFARLDSCRWLDGHILWFPHAGDALLRSLYGACRFTVYPSRAEGWGLPVGESLAFGKPCIASNATSIPEAGGDHAEYFDPMNFGECYALAEKYCFDDSCIAQRERLIATHFQPRSWADTANGIVAALKACV